MRGEHGARGSVYRCTWRHLERNGARQANGTRSIRNEIIAGVAGLVVELALRCNEDVRITFRIDVSLYVRELR